MKSAEKKFSIAFYWHMHQPVYQLNPESDYLMPWVRLHAVKDYLDMALIAEKFAGLKLNFNLVPALLDAFINYGENDFHDIHSRLTVTDVSELTDDDKEFILNNFFDANYKTMIYPHKVYRQLHQKRFSGEEIGIYDFSNQEYSDIMAWFNLVWIDSVYTELFPELELLLKKEANYTLQDRVQIIEIHKKIIRMIIPKYKELLEKGKIEITTSPYYHAILPILLDPKSSQKNLSTIDSSLSELQMEDDAKTQVKLALDRMEELFGKRPNGVWPSEHSMSAGQLELFKELGVQWTISDEGILSNSSKLEFVRDFKGYLEDPYHLMKSYKYKTKNSNIQIIFRDSVIPNLISFEYANHDPKIAAADLYDRIKVIQNKLQSSPDKKHMLTIALDGENCWENYADDGREFLSEIYSLIETDISLETVLISEYLDKEKHHKELKSIVSGSWINRNFQPWIAEPLKNLAWSYLKNVNEDFRGFLKEDLQNENIRFAHNELMIAQGSDWFWWYGEPNDSGQDHIFDYLFREHLKNVYRYLGKKVPHYLDNPLISAGIKPLIAPKTTISPKISGIEEIDDDWYNAGCVDMPESPNAKSQKVFKKVCYGADKDNFYLRVYLGDISNKNNDIDATFNLMYVYMRNGDKKQVQSPIRLVNITENIFPVMKERYHNELRILVVENKFCPLLLTKAIQGCLWAIQDSDDIQLAYKKVADIRIPFSCLDIAPGEKLEFFFASSNFGVKESFVPQDSLLNIERPYS